MCRYIISWVLKHFKEIPVLFELKKRKVTNHNSQYKLQKINVSGTDQDRNSGSLTKTK